MSSLPIVGFVGKPYLEFTQWLSDHGYEVHLFHDVHEKIRDEEKIAFSVTKVHFLDFSNKELFFEQLKNISTIPTCIVGTYENAVIPKAWLCEYFHLPGPSEKSALRSTDKSLMRRAFSQNCPEYSPLFQEVKNWSDIENFLQNPNISFPLILKPTNLFKSLLVTKSNTLSELKKNFEESVSHIAEIYAKENVLLEPRFIIEEFLEGPAYSLEVFCDSNGKSVTTPSPVDLVMGKDLGLSDNYNYSRKLPSQLTPQAQEELKKAASAGVKALALTATPAHVELVYTQKGPKIIEIGARTGGYRPRMHQLAEGIDLFQAQTNIAQNMLPDLTAHFSKYCAVYEIFPKEEGLFVEISSFDKIKELSSLFYHSIAAKKGENVGPSKNGYRFSAVFIFVNDNKDTFRKDTEFFEKNLRVIVE